MRCKPGDLAVVIGDDGVPTFEVNIGKLLEVLSPGDEVGDWTCRAISPMWNGFSFDPPGSIGDIADYLLRPIRGAPGRDETLEWAPVGESRVETL